MPSFLRLTDLAICYGNNTIIDGLSLSLNKGDIGCFLGESGCGKTTLLRAIAGFEPLCLGSIELDQTVISSPEMMLQPEQRSVGMVFQDYALFPHLSVWDNVAFGLRRIDKNTREQRVNTLLELVGLVDFKRRFIHELSGGQQQRVALARSLAPEPKLLLLDEPFSNLDIETRERLLPEIKMILKETNQTAILVTHNQSEAFSLADYVGVIANKNLAQWDTPSQIQANPANDWVKKFIRF